MRSLLPLLVFMLIPVWIPLIAGTVGALADAVRAAFGRAPEATAVEQLHARRAVLAVPEAA